MSIKSPNKDDQIIGGNLRRQRLLKGLSQEKLGDACNITFQQIQKYEKGTNGIRGSRLVQLAAVLQCPITDLFLGTSKKINGKTIDQEVDPVRALGMSSRGIQLARNFNNMPGGVQSALAHLCETIGGNDEDAERPERSSVRSKV
jgi:transcriptional regulator with XRE-family HTH domain